jgi:hypothetical protein
MLVKSTPALHVGLAKYRPISSAIQVHLRGDIMKSESATLLFLMNKYKVKLFYNIIGIRNKSLYFDLNLLDFSKKYLI